MEIFQKQSIWSSLPASLTRLSQTMFVSYIELSTVYANHQGLGLTDLALSSLSMGSFAAPQILHCLYVVSLVEFFSYSFRWTILF